MQEQYVEVLSQRRGEGTSNSGGLPQGMGTACMSNSYMNIKKLVNTIT